jgi:hypothetical protein
MRTQLTNLANPTHFTKGFHFGATQTEIQAEIGGAGISDKNVKDATEAGQRHGKFAIQGLKKLPDWAGPTYRGLSEAAADIPIKYVVNQTIDYAAFTSMSTQRNTSEDFAESEVKPAKPVPVLLILTVTKGKDIAKLSLFAGEGEVLLAPGASFRITAEAPGMVGSTMGHIVHATQVR